MSCVSDAGVACLNADVLGVGICFSLVILFICSFFTIIVTAINDVHATLSVSGLAFAYSIATAALKVQADNGLTDYDIAVASMLASCLCIWAAAITLCANNVNFFTLGVNLAINIVSLYVAFGSNGDRIELTGVDQLAYRSKSFAVVATVFTLALVLSQYFITYRQKIMKDGEVDRKGWLQTTLICLALSFLFASTAGFFLGAAYAKKDGINALKIDMTLSYGQAYSIAASITCVVSLLIAELAAFGIVKDWSVKVEPDSNAKSLPLTTVTTPDDSKQPYESRSSDSAYLPMTHQ